MAQRKPGSAAKSAGKTAAGPAARKSATGSTARKTTAGSAARKTGATASSTRTSGTKSAAAKPTASKSAAAKPAGGRPPNRKPGKSIVNQKQTPWGLIAAATAVVLFAAAIIIVVVATRKSDTAAADHTTKGGQSVKETDPYRRSALPAAMAISGVTYRVEAQHTHVTGTIKYDSSPPVGGDHNQYWANCTGTVYSKQIANENAVHMLEHGAIWITYNPDDISGAKLATLKKYVSGQDRMALTPYAGLKTPISLQAWGYQLFLSSPSDPRIAQFIKVLKYNQKTTPEYGASCSDQYFKASESRPGHPFEG